MTQVMYDVPSDPTIAKVTINAACVKDGAEPEILRDPQRTQRPPLGKASLHAERGGLPVPTLADEHSNSPAVPGKRRARGCFIL